MAETLLKTLFKIKSNSVFFFLNNRCIPCRKRRKYWSLEISSLVWKWHHFSSNNHPVYSGTIYAGTTVPLTLWCALKPKRFLLFHTLVLLSLSMLSNKRGFRANMNFSLLTCIIVSAVTSIAADFATALGYCIFMECCTDRWIPNNFDGLNFYVTTAYSSIS